MGWRYRKRIKIIPGFHINVSKSGISANIGIKGANMTFGPNGTYVNTGLPGSGLYRRDKIYSRADKSKSATTYYSIANPDEILNDDRIPLQELFTINDSGLVVIPSFKAQYYIWYLIAFLMPFVGFLLYGHWEWWMFFSCLVVDVIQLVCWAFVMTTEVCYFGDSCCKLKRINNDKEELNCEIRGHITRCILSVLLAISNLFPLFAMSKSFISSFNSLFYSKYGLPYFIQSPYSGGYLVFLFMLIMVVLWGGCAFCEIEYLKKLNNLKEQYYDNIAGDSENKLSSEESSIQNDEHIDNENPLQTENNHTPSAQPIMQAYEEKVSPNHDISPFLKSPLYDFDKANLASHHNLSNAPYNPKQDLPEYRYPTIDLLQTHDMGRKLSFDRNKQDLEKSRIIELLRSFGIQLTYISSTIGPRFTFYEVRLAPGVSMSKIQGLEADIALALCSQDVQILAPIPGKVTIGIITSNTIPTKVPLRSVISAKQFQETTMDLPCALGWTITNEAFVFDLAKAPHILIGGATGQGKSMLIHTIITSLLFKKHPAELKFVLMDSLGLELLPYNQLANHFLASLSATPEVVSDSKTAVNSLTSLCNEMDNRYELLRLASVRNIKEYNTKFCNRHLNCDIGHRYMPYIVVVIDECGIFIDEKETEIEWPLSRLAKNASKVGIHMIISTSQMANDVVINRIKIYFPTRISLRLPNRVDSQAILDTDGAERLIGNGDMLLLNDRELVRVQAPYIDNLETERICKFISKQQGYSSPYELPSIYFDY